MGVCDIVDVGCGFLCKDREFINFFDLSVFDFGILIGVFYKVNYDFLVVFDG